MRNIYVLPAALEAVESNLKEAITAEELARAIYCSASGLQKLFRYAFGCPVKEYILKRRLCVAARELLETGKSITEIALEYQYASPEAFARAFKRLWGISPSEFRRSRRFYGLFPKFVYLSGEGADNMKYQKRKPLDISEMYDYIKKMAGTYALSVDLKNFSLVNKNYGCTAGDLVIANAFARIENNIDEGMLLFRTGGDEFAVITGYKNLGDAERLARSITAQNGEPVAALGHEIPLSVWVGISKLPEDTLNYKKALELMIDAVDCARQSDGDVGIL